jgi:hypothetical protein
MSEFTVRKGKRYQASIRLGLLEQIADNRLIASKLEQAGFSDVSVSGSGTNRTAEALWPNEDASAPLPAQVHSVVEIA